MCLAIPGKVIEIYDENGITMGRIDYAGIIKTACLEYVPDVQVGQYAMVHAGFAISVVDEDEAKKTLELWRAMAQSELHDQTDVLGEMDSDTEESG